LVKRLAAYQRVLALGRGSTQMKSEKSEILNQKS
jgi:hypothetical protein